MVDCIAMKGFVSAAGCRSRDIDTNDSGVDNDSVVMTDVEADSTAVDDGVFIFFSLLIRISFFYVEILVYEAYHSG